MGFLLGEGADSYGDGKSTFFRRINVCHVGERRRLQPWKDNWVNG